VHAQQPPEPRGDVGAGGRVQADHELEGTGAERQIRGDPGLGGVGWGDDPDRSLRRGGDPGVRERRGGGVDDEAVGAVGRRVAYPEDGEGQRAATGGRVEVQHLTGGEAALQVCVEGFDARWKKGRVASVMARGGLDEGAERFEGASTFGRRAHGRSAGD